MASFLIRKEVYYYGAIGFERAICPTCRCDSIVRRGKSICCDAKIVYDDISPIQKRVAETGRRKGLLRGQKDKILKKQKNKCFYCGQKLGSIVHKNGEPIELKTHFDHKIPFVTSGNSYPYNYVASCHVCNSSKSDTIFETLDDARNWLRYIRKQKGYDF